MSDEFLISIDEVKPVRIRELAESALCISYDKRSTHFYLAQSDNHRTAVFLSGPNAFEAFDVDIVHSWKGIAFTKARIEVDPFAAFDSEAEWAPIGTVTVGHQGARLHVRMNGRHGFEGLGLPLPVQVDEVSAGLDVGFKKWRFVIGEGLKAKTVLAFDLTDGPTTSE
jgi:hypothetical protein